jgi:nicotinamide riboside kinase
MKKVVSTGPESSGKTTLMEGLSAHFQVPFVPEMARMYLTQKKGNYQLDDLIQIAALQIISENKQAANNPDLLLCDTDILTILVWMEDKFQYTHQELLATWLKNRADLYLLCYPDFPWQFDSLREDEHRRDDILAKYLRWLRQYDCVYLPLQGTNLQRMEQVIKAL